MYAQSVSWTYFSSCNIVLVVDTWITSSGNFSFSCWCLMKVPNNKKASPDVALSLAVSSGEAFSGVTKLYDFHWHSVHAAVNVGFLISIAQTFQYLGLGVFVGVEVERLYDPFMIAV
ncbi:hypothetical protein Tco_0938922 [Tanacetum coccineum]|uniref:Uncharacterized protein n=1 Tax=Tanacetum coccineum TaxID=301880 RepID=A0ABQ5DJ77_9ASTR